VAPNSARPALLGGLFSEKIIILSAMACKYDRNKNAAFENAVLRHNFADKSGARYVACPIRLGVLAN